MVVVDCWQNSILNQTVLNLDQFGVAITTLSVFGILDIGQGWREHLVVVGRLTKEDIDIKTMATIWVRLVMLSA